MRLGPIHSAPLMTHSRDCLSFLSPRIESALLYPMEFFTERKKIHDSYLRAKTVLTIRFSHILRSETFLKSSLRKTPERDTESGKNKLPGAREGVLNNECHVP